MKKHFQGFTLIEIVVVIGIIGIIGVGILKFGRSNSNQPRSNTPVSESQTNNNQGRKQNQSQAGDKSSNRLIWSLSEDGYKSMETPPVCPTPLKLASPANVSQVTSILYPGQTRGGNYKPHGGFRFDNISDNKVTVTTPMDGFVIQGARYLVDGETQYTFDVINNCGIMYRLGHLLTLTSKFQTMADQFPPAAENDSRTTSIQPAIEVKSGEEMATAVGIKKGSNTFFDFGVYDLRQKNEASKNSTWANNPAHDPQLAQRAVCWFDLLPINDAARVKSLPAADPQSGKTSDYCK